MAFFERIVFAQEAVQRFGKHAPVVIETKIHGNVPRLSAGDHRPSLVLEMMPRWISLEPAKIDNFRLLK